MTIIEMPRRARAAGRASGGSLVARFFAPLVSRHGTGRSHAQPKIRMLERKPEGRPAAPRTAAKPLPGNAPLASLAGGSLAARFHSWRGCSGRRYIFSVFPIDPADAEAGLPDFAEAIALAVTSDGKRRHCLSLFLSESGTGADARRHFIATALSAGAGEWHVHLLAADAPQRRAIARDLEAARFGAASAVR